MRASIDTRLAKLETVIRPVSAGRRFTLMVIEGTDHDTYLRDKGITLAPEDDVMWIELVPVMPQPGDRGAEIPK